MWFSPALVPPQQYSRLNSSSQTNSLKDLLQSKIDDLERQVLSRVNTLEEGKGGPKNDTEERVKIESALTSLHQRISELEKGKSSGGHAACSRLPLETWPGSRSLPWPLVLDPHSKPSPVRASRVVPWRSSWSLRTDCTVQSGHSQDFFQV